MPQIQIPSPLRQYSGKQASIDVPAKTVGEALAGLVSRHPDLKRHLYTDDGKLRAFVNVYVNDEDMRYLQKEATPLKDGDTISIVPSIAGGYLEFMATLSEIKPDLAKSEAVLSNDEILRYSRHLIMPEVGMEGQQKLKAAKVLCIGAGGLGSPLALYLTAAGVGTLGIVDFDVVDYTNLQRQIIHSTADVGRKKLDSAADK